MFLDFKSDLSVSSKDDALEIIRDIIHKVCKNHICLQNSDKLLLW